MKPAERRAAFERTVKYGGLVEVSAEDLAALEFDQYRYREQVHELIARSALFTAPAPLVLSPAVAAQLGVRGFDGRPAAHEPSQALVSLLLTDPRQERARV